MGPRAEALYLYSFFNFGARIGGLSMTKPGRFTCEKKTGTHYIGFWMAPWAVVVYFYS